MSFVVKKFPLAEEDALEAAIWYEQRQARLGEDFLAEVDRAIRELSRDALQYRIRFADVRRKPIHRFKFYGVYYLVRGNEVWVLAIFHGRRHPRTLEERVTQID
jgi:plasmid stabilization system protein ParE